MTTSSSDESGMLRYEDAVGIYTDGSKSDYGVGRGNYELVY